MTRNSAALFQSSPTPKGGRYTQALAQDLPIDYVSILAHPERWALRSVVPFLYRFHPVSILAHPERWALQRAMIFKETYE